MFCVRIGGFQGFNRSQILCYAIGDTNIINKMVIVAMLNAAAEYSRCKGFRHNASLVGIWVLNSGVRCGPENGSSCHPSVAKHIK